MRDPGIGRDENTQRPVSYELEKGEFVTEFGLETLEIPRNS